MWLIWIQWIKTWLSRDMIELWLSFINMVHCPSWIFMTNSSGTANLLINKFSSRKMLLRASGEKKTELIPTISDF